MRSAVLTLASVGLTLAVLGNAWVQRQQFYPSVVYITKSNPSMAVIYLQSLVVVILLGRVMRKIFFGQLRAAEFEHLMERSWYAVTETCLAFTVFKDDFSPKFVALFVLLLFLKSFHWLAEDRVDFMERSPVITLIFHLRVLSLAVVLASLDILFIQNAYHSTITKGASVQLVFGFEYAVLMTIVLNTVVKYVLHSVDLYSEAPWENKAVFMLYTELFIGLVKVILYLMFFVIMVRIYTLPLFAVRPMYLTMRAFKKAFNDVLLSRRAIHNMNTMYPDATAEELSNTDNVCIICREEMAAPTAKKLPCNHIFHKNCLRSWFQRQQTCPTCRLDVLRQPAAATPPAAPAAGVPPAAAAFQQQMAALRQQLEAMQQQRQQQQQQQLYNIMAAGAAAAAQPPASPPPTPAATATDSGSSGLPLPSFPAAGGGSGAAARSPPFLFPPFPFMPWAVPPPMPPPNFQGLSEAELLQMEGTERQHVEARIRCLRNIQVLLDAAVMEMQQYSAVVARCTTQQNIASATAAPATAPATPAATASPAATNAPTAGTTAVLAKPVSASATSITSDSTSATSAVDGSLKQEKETDSTLAGSVATSNKDVGPKSYAETGARPKVKDSPVVTSVEAVVVKPAADGASSAAADNDIIPSDQEEVRRRRLAVFEEQKRRLMKNIK